MTVIAVLAGGGLGALTRYRFEGVIAERQRTPFPLSTLLINVSGSALLGILAGLLSRGTVSETTMAWGGTGFLGGYTTFSTFTYETVRLIEDGAWRYVGLNLMLSGPLSFGAAGAGYFLVRAL